jgi:eukaryotic-like serine/threonine-protein kinase
VFELYADQCAPARLEAGRSYSNSADCAEAHDFEVLSALDPFGSDEKTPYPGLDALKSMAEASCALVFGTAGVVPADQRDQLAYSSLAPIEESWTAPSSDMDRSLYCLVSRRDGKQLTEDLTPSD